MHKTKNMLLQSKSGQFCNVFLTFRREQSERVEMSCKYGRTTSNRWIKVMSIKRFTCYKQNRCITLSHTLTDRGTNQLTLCILRHTHPTLYCIFHHWPAPFGMLPLCLFAYRISRRECCSTL